MSDMRICAVFGNPVDHSLSPMIHQTFAKECGILLTYKKQQVTDDSFSEDVITFFTNGGLGLNITLPFKELAYQMADIHMPAAKKAKAANTLWMEQGRLVADNTDGSGLVTDLCQYLPLTSLRLHIIGAGGAARGIIQPLLDAGVKSLSLSNRTQERAITLQSDFPEIQVIPWQDNLPEVDILINTTSASYSAQSVTWPTFTGSSPKLAYDLAYSQTGETRFLQHYQPIVEKTVDGIGMLIEQAALSFERWHHIHPDTESIRHRLCHS